MKGGIKAGLITAIPPEPLWDRRRHWERIGFLSRAIPVSYSYKPSTVCSILEYIEKEEHLREEVRKLNLPKEAKRIVLAYQFAKEIETINLSLRHKLTRYTHLYGFRLQKQLQTMAKSIALLMGKEEVDEDEKVIEEMKPLIDFIGFDMKAL